MYECEGGCCLNVIRVKRFISLHVTNCELVGILTSFLSDPDA